MDQPSSSVQFDEFGVPKRESCLYAACYCEENVWQLCKAIQDRDPSRLEPFNVVFVTNKSKTIPLWHQKAGSNEEGFVMWDYHVILVRSPDASSIWSMVYDLDTTLKFPCSFIEYFSQAIRPDHTFRVQYQRKFRVIPASRYLTLFGSDRSHMRKPNGEWLSPPPPWPCIQNMERKNTIMTFWSTADFWTAGEGEVNSETDIEIYEASEVLDTEGFQIRYGSGFF